LEILLVEDSWVLGEAMKDLLELLGADVVGPAATNADAERLLAEHAPDGSAEGEGKLPGKPVHW
jgi:hypothetical protein